jgi:hypothetical protein
MQKTYHGLCKQFSSPDYQIMVRGSWAVFVHAKNSGKFSDQQLLAITPEDLDIFLCYKTHKHNVNLDDSIRKLSIKVDEQQLEFTTLQEKTNSKTFKLTTVCETIPSITTIDVNRRTTNPLEDPCVFVDHCNVMYVKLQVLSQDYQIHSPDTSNMSKEQAATKILKHGLKKSMLEEMTKYLPTESEEMTKYLPTESENSRMVSDGMVSDGMVSDGMVSSCRILDFSLCDE